MPSRRRPLTPKQLDLHARITTKLASLPTQEVREIERLIDYRLAVSRAEAPLDVPLRVGTTAPSPRR